MEKQHPGTHLSLKNLVNALVRVTEWFELGLQLGIEEHVLKRIEQDHSGRTERCKSDMLSEWLNNGLGHSWEEVYVAVEEVGRRSDEKRRRDEENNRQHDEERRTLEAVRQIKKSMEKINNLIFDECEEEKTKLANKLKEKNQEWEKFKRRWRNEDERWIKQEERRQRIEEAIRARNFRGSEFVRGYLREKSMPADISREAVESCLREDILHKKVVRVQQLLTRRQETKNHQTALKHLQEDSEKWIKQLEDHRERLERDVLSKFEDMGLKTDKIRELRKHLKELACTLRDCKSALEDCSRALEKTEDPLMEFHRELREFSGSFELSIDYLKQSSEGLTVHRTELEESINNLEEVILGLMGALGGTAGAVAGVTIGAVGGPPGALFGAIVGVIVGGVVGIVKGANAHAEKLRQNEQQLKTLKTELTATDKIALDCQRTEQTVKELLKTFSKIR